MNWLSSNQNTSAGSGVAKSNQNTSAGSEVAKSNQNTSAGSEVATLNANALLNEEIVHNKKNDEQDSKSDSFFAKIKKVMQTTPLNKDDMKKAIDTAFGKVDGNLISHVALTTGKIMEIIPIFDKIGSVIVGLAKMKIDYDAFKRIKETVLDPISKLQNILLFFLKMNEITKEMVKNVQDEINAKIKLMEDEIKALQDKLTQETKELENTESTNPTVSEQIQLKIEDNKQDIIETTNENKQEILDEQKSLLKLIETVNEVSVSTNTIEKIQKTLGEIENILTDQSLIKEIIYTDGDKINKIDIIMKSMDQEMQTLMLQYATFVFVVGISFGKFNESMPSEFLTKIIATQEFQNFAKSTNTMVDKTAAINPGNVAAKILGVASEMRGGRRQYRTKRRKPRGKKKTSRRNGQMLRKTRKKVLYAAYKDLK